MAVAALVMLSTIMLGIGILTSQTVKEMQLMRDAEMTALRWASIFKDRNEDTSKMFRERRASHHANIFGWNTQEVGRIIAYELYDSAGHLFFSSGASNWAPEEKVGEMLRSPITRNHNQAAIPTTALHRPETAGHVSHYASVAIPFHMASDYIGSVVAFVDQTEQAGSLTYSFRIIAIATALLLLLTAGGAAHVVISKSRERLKALDLARYLSDHDELSGLPNRQSFNAKLDALLANNSPKNIVNVSVIFIDIDRFKEINDALGHSVGDGVLRCVAERINSKLSEGDFAARLGSNEFAVALASVKGTKKVAAFASALRGTLTASMMVYDEEISCTYSMGVACAPSDGEDCASITRHANLALNDAKKEGPGALKFFEHRMNVAFRHRREREKDMKNAVERGEFEVHFQPQICLETYTICGQEALLRWEHPVHGKISPAYFIPLAEETELIVPISEWVLRRACTEAVGWDKPLNVAVNLSPVQFKHGGVAKLVSEVLAETGLKPERLELEITESILMGDNETVVAELEKLRALGVAIAMDDFGTGYSSLSYISSFPFNKIKIDKSFIHAMDRDNALNAIVKCIVAMGHSLDVTITAEGVETEEQSAMLRDYGCHQMQGFLYGYPVSAEECARQIAESTIAEPLKSSPSKPRKAVA